jgi:hypothetical protein
MLEIRKRPQVVRDLIDIATYITPTLTKAIAFFSLLKQHFKTWPKCQESVNAANFAALN